MGRGRMRRGGGMGRGGKKCKRRHGKRRCSKVMYI